MEKSVKVTNPQWRPITSIMNVRWCEYAVLTMASMASIMRCKAESVPMVMSVPQKSLSIEPTMPAMWRSPNFLRWSALMRCVSSSSSSKLLHSCRNRLAPVNDPSPPITTYIWRRTFCICMKWWQRDTHAVGHLPSWWFLFAPNCKRPTNDLCVHESRYSVPIRWQCRHDEWCWTPTTSWPLECFRRHQPYLGILHG